MSIHAKPDSGHTFEDWMNMYRGSYVITSMQGLLKLHMAPQSHSTCPSHIPHHSRYLSIKAICDLQLHHQAHQALLAHKHLRLPLKVQSARALSAPPPSARVQAALVPSARVLPTLVPHHFLQVIFFKRLPYLTSTISIFPHL